MNTEIFDLGKIGITLGGEYDNKVVYEKLTIVLYKGKSYISTKITHGVSPEQNILVWQLVAEAKDAYDMLVAEGKTTLTKEEFLEQLVDATKGRYVIQGNLVNAADEEDLTVEHSDLLGIDTLKLANRDNTNGMGYVILRKNKSFAEQVTKENTIYEIRYDFILNNENITIPNNCVLKFKGGSLNDGTLTGNNTFIKAYDNAIIFKKNLIITGKFENSIIFANWFEADCDSDMFQRAFDTSNNIVNSYDGHYTYISKTVTCISKTYNIDKPMLIKVGTSFNGNNCCWYINYKTFPAPTIVDGEPTGQISYILYVNVRPGETQWISSYPNNGYEELCNLYVANIESVVCHFCNIHDSRHVHDIKVFRTIGVLHYGPEYLDGRVIERIWFEGGTNQVYPMDFTTESKFHKTCQYIIGLGDDCSLRDVNGGGAYITNGATCRIDGSMISLCVNTARNIVVNNTHTEAERFIVVGHSQVTFVDCTFWAVMHGNIELKAYYNEYPEIYLRNVQFGVVENQNYNDFFPIKGEGKITCENVHARLLNISGGTGHLGTDTIAVYRNKTQIINPIRYVENLRKILEDNINFTYDTVKNINIGDSQHITGTDLFYRRYLLADKDRHLYFDIHQSGKEYNIQANSFSIHDYADTNSVQALSGCVIRYEFGLSSNTPLVYFDYGLVNKSLESRNITIVEDSNEQIGYKINIDMYGNVLNTKPVDYTPKYYKLLSYERKGCNVKCLLDSDDLPDSSLFKTNDIITLNNGSTFIKQNNYWNIISKPKTINSKLLNINENEYLTIIRDFSIWNNNKPYPTGEYLMVIWNGNESISDTCIVTKENYNVKFIKTFHNSHYKKQVISQINPKTNGIIQYQIPNKDNITDFSMYIDTNDYERENGCNVKLNINAFKNCNNLNYFEIGEGNNSYKDIVGDLTVFKNKPLTKISLPKTSVIGDLSMLSDIETLKHINVKGSMSIKTSRNTLDSLRNKGVEVIILDSQIY